MSPLALCSGLWSPFVSSQRRPMRLLVLALVAWSMVGGTGCDTAGPVVTELAVVSDTNFTEGPYEVEAVLKDDARITSVELLYEGVGLAESVPMTRMSDADEDAVRFVGDIAGQPLGTVVHYGIRACDEYDNCALHPADFPSASEQFVVGKLPSNPRITRINPDRGPSSGGTRVEIYGSDFRDGAEVFFGDNQATHVEWMRSTLLVAVAPPHDPDTVPVRVRNPDAIDEVAENAFTYFPSPELVAVVPPEGPSSGGTEVEVIGAFFPDDMRVFFDGVPCRHLLLLSSSTATCETPPGRPGFVDVTAEHPEFGIGLLEDGYEYIPPPVVDAVSPDRGPDQGGTEIVITGEFFDEDATVLVGGQPCAELIYVDDTTLICTTAPGVPGVQDVEVVNPDGQSGVLIGGFNYLGPPIIVRVDPDLGPHFGGVEVRILGAGFTDDMLVLFDDEEAEIIDVVDDIELTVIVPPSVIPLQPAPETGLAAVDVTVVNLDPNDGRSDTLDDAYTYFWPPEVTSVEPPSGPTAGGTNVVVRGRFFRHVPDGEFHVAFGDNPAISFTVTSTTAITAVTPPGPAGFVDVRVENYPMSFGVLEDGYEYIPPPIVERVEPDVGPTFGGERVSVIGQFFQQGAQVFFGDALCTDVVFISSTELQCTTPPGEEGFVDVTVVNPDTQQDTAERAYEYIGVVVLPDFGLPVGFTRVRVLGAGMQPGAVVRFGNVIANECTWVSSTEMVCQTPAVGQVGPVTVSFSNPDGTGDDAEEAFTYRQFLDETGSRSDDVDEEASYAVFADLDNDGDQDIAVAIDDETRPDHILLNDGDGNFFDRVELPSAPANYFSQKVTVGDANGDDLPDLVFAHNANTTGELSNGTHMYRNLGDGEFERFTIPGVTSFGSYDAQLVDLVGDARDDLVVFLIGCRPGGDQPEVENANCANTDLNSDMGQDLVFVRSGAGNFTLQPNLIPHEFDFTHDHRFVAVDLDNDGDRDLVINADTLSFPNPTFPNNRHRIYYNRVNEGLGFEEESAPFVNAVGEVFGIDAGDVDGNGFADVVMPNCGQNFGNAELLFRNSGGDLTQDFAAVPGHPGDCDFGVHLFDVDNDNDLDVVYVGDREGTLNVKVYVNRGNGTYVDAADWVQSFFGRPLRGVSARTADVDGDGDNDLIVAAMGLPTVGGALRVYILE